MFGAPVERTERAGRPIYRRFSLPYMFKPQLSLAEAAIAALAAFLRIFSGSLLFALYGWYAMVAWRQIRSPWWRAAALPPIVAVFLLLFALLMAAISAMLRRVLPKD